MSVIESNTPAIIIGTHDIEMIQDKNSHMEAPTLSGGKWKEVEVRLEEVLAAARVDGMSRADLKRAQKLLTKRTRDFWSKTLGPNDKEAVPPLVVG